MKQIVLTDFGYKSNDTGFSIGTNFEYLEDLYFAPRVFVNYDEKIETSSAASKTKKQEGKLF